MGLDENDRGSHNSISSTIRNVIGDLVAHRNRLIVPGLLSLVLLFVIQSTAITVTFTESIGQYIIVITAIFLLFFVEISIVWAGIIPSAISILGIVLVLTGIVIPLYGFDLAEEGNFKGIKILITHEAIIQAADAYFYLGISMLCLGIIIAFRPGLLYTKNRPKSIDSMWDGYEIWDDNLGSRAENIGRRANQFAEPVIPIKILMNEKEKYLLWRYEYVLTAIHGHHYLVGTNCVVPTGSVILRDDSGRMMGKSKYSGFFV
ncbi:MAG TPA: hypothetical protein VH500_07700 [Nitrososphaeraceae archaeon]